MSGSLIKRGRATMIVATGAMALTMVSSGGAQAATAARTCTIKSFTPTKFVVAATETERQFAVKTTGCTQKSWRVDLVVSDGNVLLATKAEPVTTFVPAELDNALAGSYQVLVTVKSTDNKTSKKKFAFSLLRRSTFGNSFNVGPEPARRNATVKLVGTLTRVSWGKKPHYVAYPNRTVRVQFKASGTKTFLNVKSATTDAAGKVSTTVTTKKSGTWRLHYAGNAATGAADSKGDAVAVS
jgi:hypothetical protein